MRSKAYFDLCVRQLSILAYEVELRGSVNILDLNIHCEDFYARFLNLLFGYSLANTNAVERNAASIDLVDHRNKLILQVSATATRQKVQAALSNPRLGNYKGYTFKFIPISKDARALRKMSFKGSFDVGFSPSSDILDLEEITSKILHEGPSRQQEIYKFLQAELSNDDPRPPSETNIAALIKILGQEDLSGGLNNKHPIPFGIEEKINFNKLNIAEEIISSYAPYQSRVEKIYAQFDMMGKNKSLSVLGMFNSKYLKLKTNGLASDDLFFEIVGSTVETVRNSSNYTPISEEELELCVQILAVDAFVRCRIFANPKVANNAAA